MPQIGQTVDPDELSESFVVRFPIPSEFEVKSPSSSNSGTKDGDSWKDLDDVSDVIDAEVGAGDAEIAYDVD